MAHPAGASFAINGPTWTRCTEGGPTGTRGTRGWSRRGRFRWVTEQAPPSDWVMAGKDGRDGIEETTRDQSDGLEAYA
jgi:hypothetical protein